MILLKSFRNIFYIPELCRKLLITLGILVVYRIGLVIPAIGVDVAALQSLSNTSDGIVGMLNYMDMLSGGGLLSCTIFALGVQPYITASIMMQLLGMAFPYFERLVKEGEYGRQILSQYTKYLAVFLGITWSIGYALVLERNGFVVSPGWFFRIMFVITLTVGSMLVMWLGDQISLFGIGNGSSLIIFAGIVARFPTYVQKTIAFVRLGNLDLVIAWLFLVIFVMVTFCIIFLEKGEYKVPIQYARRIIGNKVYGGQNTYLPIKLNTANIMPVIFASTLLMVPMQLVGFLSARFAFLSGFASPTNPFFAALKFLLIIFFSFVWTSMYFNPEELAENLKKNGGFIPGRRPGRRTAEFFHYVLNRIGLIGALYLALLDLFPTLLTLIINMPFYLTGTGLLIVVGVALDLSAQIESYLIEHRYEGFLASGRLRGRRLR